MFRVTSIYKILYYFNSRKYLVFKEGAPGESLIYYVTGKAGNSDTVI